MTLFANWRLLHVPDCGRKHTTMALYSVSDLPQQIICFQFTNKVIAPEDRAQAYFVTVLHVILRYDTSS